MRKKLDQDTGGKKIHKKNILLNSAILLAVLSSGCGTTSKETQNDNNIDVIGFSELGVSPTQEQPKDNKEGTKQIPGEHDIETPEQYDDYEEIEVSEETDERSEIVLKDIYEKYNNLDKEQKKDILNVIEFETTSLRQDPLLELHGRRLGEHIGYGKNNGLQQLNKDVNPLDKNSSIFNYEKLNIPLINPEILKHTGKNLSEFLGLYTKFQSHIDENDTVIVVTTIKNGENAVLYFEEGNLKFASITSVGTKDSKTPEGVYTTSGNFIADKTSFSYEDAPMAYSIQIGSYRSPYFLHAGTTDGEKRSNGCIRLPGIYAKNLFEITKEKAKNSGPIKVVIKDLY
ncbi:L,D-transpeptidase [Candidatus Absconditicoccus praedator]|uniref:L,D-transpeptidase n=1 Tax=Candidatus Absconditicoccus praedator TaxID=2735562 RepID=UPI001E500E50|nr:L,D-transpeptidase [Candidatus Absconditicoccus praedator]UFX83456.1 L,D-transpeptidase [Candidatus Absconditicoccus praedator]